MYETLTHYIHFITNFSQLSKSIDYNDLVHRDGLYYEKFTNEPFTGNSTGLKQGKIIDGILQGEWLCYYANGQIQWKVNYKDGEPEGEDLYYHNNGQLGLKKYFKDGKKEGEHLTYNKNGKLTKTQIYKDGKLIETIYH